MARFSQKTLTFPMAGVTRRAGYREQSRPYSAPWAYNVRGTGAVESRRRGGSRPGMTKVFADPITGARMMVPVSTIVGDVKNRLLIIVDNNGSLCVGNSAAGTVAGVSAVLTTDDGTTIITDDEIDIVFGAETSAVTGVERAGKVLLPGTALQEYDPGTGVVETIAASMGEVPADCPVICVYRDRVFLAGVNHLWYCSRQSDPTDWHFSADMNDVGAAMAGHLAVGGEIGEKITALIPIDDSRLVMATENEIWVLQGDPADGSLSRLSGVGVLSPTAWARNPDGVIVFLSKDGVYTMSGAARPERWSEERIPEELRNIVADDFVISMGWDDNGRGFHLFLTPVDTEENGTHWWLDMESKAFWPVLFSEHDHNPVAAARHDSATNVSMLAMAGRDGIIRVFDPVSSGDDGETIASQVAVGPVRLPSDDLTDALLTEIAGMISGGVNTEVTWRLVSASNAEDAATKAREAIETLGLGAAVTAYPSGVWGPGRAHVDRPRQRGAWVVICLHSEDQWALEALATKSYTLGRLRHGH